MKKSTFILQAIAFALILAATMCADGLMDLRGGAFIIFGIIGVIWALLQVAAHIESRNRAVYRRYTGQRKRRKHDDG